MKFLILTAALAAACAVSLFSGPAGFDPQLILMLRLPRVLSACVAGAGLALSGAVFQGVLKNPLCDPYILGTSAGAAAAAVLCMLCGIGTASPFFYVLVFCGSFLGTFLSYFTAGRAGKISDASLVLSGVAVSAFLTAAVMLFLSMRADRAMPVVSFIMGGYSDAGFAEIGVCAFFVLSAFAAAVEKRRVLDIMPLGEEKAYHLGISLGRDRAVFFVIACLASSSSVALFGTVGFVGLMIPHIMRYIFGPSASVLLPSSFLGGALMLTAADTLGRNLMPPADIPAGVVMALFGAPFFIWLLWKRRSAFHYASGECLQAVALKPAPPQAPAGGETLLSASGISFGYTNADGKERRLFSDLSFCIRKNSITAVLGPNGIGKSTLLKCLSGYYRTSGRVILKGRQVSGMSAAEISREIAYVPSEISTPYDFTAEEFVMLGTRNISGFWQSYDREDRNRVSEALKVSGVYALRNRMYNSLSSGEKQLVLIAQAEVQDTDIIILDEPSSHLDLRYKYMVMEKLRKLACKGCGIAVVLHEPQLARLCDETLLFFPDGSQVIMKPEEALKRENVTRLYGLSGPEERVFLMGLKS